MRIFGIICLLGALISCGNNKSAKEKQINTESIEAIATKIEVKKMDFDILIVYRIDCDEFENFKNNTMSLYSTKNRDTINQFLNAINELERDSTKHFIDVRAKLFIFYQNNKIDTLCMNRHLVKINNEFYSNSKRMIGLIEELSYNEKFD